MPSPYRIPAPPPPGPTWWERYGDHVKATCTLAGIGVLFALFCTCLTQVKACNDEADAERVRYFEKRVAKCPIVDIDYGHHSEDPIMATLNCKTFQERRRVPPGYQLPR